MAPPTSPIAATSDEPPVGRPIIEFCGVPTTVDREPFTIGRDADLVIEDDNRFLHRRFLSLSSRQGIWMLTNIGSRLTATASDPDGRLQAFLAPHALLPLVFDRTLVRFTAGPTTYELTIEVPDPPFSAGPTSEDDRGDTTIGRVTMTPDQLRLVLVLAEPALRGTGRAATTMPTSTEAAARLGWTITKFNRKLDNVCQKLAAQGVRGLHGRPGRLASNRRARLVEYALAVGLVTRDDLDVLERAEPVDPIGSDDAETSSGTST